MLTDERILALGKRFRLFVVTGRYRREYEAIWGARLDPFFEEVLCVDDYPELPGKPAPDQLRYLAKKYGLERFIYVGNSVDDMRAARDAGGTALGVTTTATEKELKKAGARLVLGQAADIPGRFGQ
jgi:phosphoglycolate phosphatase-like HAD superfamily hydrolase